MFKLDDNFLNELGLGALPPAEKNKMLAHIYETLEMRVGMRLAEKMTNEQLDEFEAFINKNDEAGALQWLETNFPNYKEVVAEELEKLKAEIRQVAPQIVAQAQELAQANPPQPAQAPVSAQPQMQAPSPAPVVPPAPQQQAPVYGSQEGSSFATAPGTQPQMSAYSPQYAPSPAPAQMPTTAPSAPDANFTQPAVDGNFALQSQPILQQQPQVSPSLTPVAPYDQPLQQTQNPALNPTAQQSFVPQSVPQAPLYQPPSTDMTPQQPSVGHPIQFQQPAQPTATAQQPYTPPTQHSQPYTAPQSGTQQQQPL